MNNSIIINRSLIMRPPSSRKRSWYQGFSLVEVSLALLVVSVGILGAFALIPAGLQTNRAAIDDTKAAMFADTVFESLRASAWTAKNFAEVGAYTNSFPYAGQIGSRTFFHSSSVSTISMAVPLTQSLDYKNIRPFKLIAADDSTITELALNYRLSRISTSDRKSCFCLEVFPPEIIDPANPPERLIFYTEILNPK